MIKNSGLKFTFFTYAIIITVFLLFSLFSFASDKILMLTGHISQVELTSFTSFDTFDFILNESDEQAKTGVTNTQDVKLVLDDFSETGTDIIRTVHMDMSFSLHPGEVVLFYAKEGEDFSDAKKIWAKQQNDGVYTFTLPRTQKIDKIRIDPSSVYNNELYLNSITLNSSLTLSKYFTLSNEQIFNFLLYPLLTCAFIYYIFSQFISESAIYIKFKNFTILFLQKVKKRKIN